MTNFSQGKPESRTPTVTDAVIEVSPNQGFLATRVATAAGELPALTDGLQYTVIPNLLANAYELQMDFTASVDYLKLSSFKPADLQGVNLWVWQNNSWSLIDPGLITVAGDMVTVSGGTVPTDKLKITLPQVVALNELKAFGSKVTQTAPQITLTQPEGTTVNVGAAVKIEGKVDKAGSTITVNGHPVQLQGDSFSYPSFVNGDDQTFKVEITATDQQGRKGILAKTFQVNQAPSAAWPVINCDLPERYYTKETKIIVRGLVSNVQEVKINSVSANLQTGMGTYSKEVELAEGENKVLIEAKSPSGALTKLERRVICDTQAPVLTISGTTQDAGRVTIKGIYSDVSPVEVWINAQKASLAENSFSYIAELREGENQFMITAKDAVGNETFEELTVTQELPVFSVSSKASIASESGPPPIVVDYRDVAAYYEVPSVNGSRTTSPFGSWFNNNREWVSPTNGGLMIQAKDLVLPGRDGFDLELVRAYSSEKAQSDLIAPEGKPQEIFNAFGVGWMINIPWISGQQVILPEGQMINFGSTVFTSPYQYEYHQGVHFVLEYNPESKGYTLTMNDGIKYLFDAAGKATAKISPNGQNAIHFVYNGRELAEITDSLGRKIVFTYKTVNTQRLIQSIAVNNRIIEYDYYDNGLLKWVIEPLGRKTEYKYTCFAGKQFGQKYRFKEKYFDIISFHGDEVDQIKTYDIS